MESHSTMARAGVTGLLDVVEAPDRVGDLTSGIFSGFRTSSTFTGFYTLSMFRKSSHKPGIET